MCSSPLTFSLFSRHSRLAPIQSSAHVLIFLLPGILFPSCPYGKFPHFIQSTLWWSLPKPPCIKLSPSSLTFYMSSLSAYFSLVLQQNFTCLSCYYLSFPLDVTPTGQNFCCSLLCSSKVIAVYIVGTEWIFGWVGPWIDDRSMVRVDGASFDYFPVPQSEKKNWVNPVESGLYDTDMPKQIL